MPVPQPATQVIPDFVTTDFEALASHMRHCARAQGRWFSVRNHMQGMRALAAGRIVTMACAVLAVGIAVFVLA